ncbi:hypothetical protein JVT61DRAFT_12679 [Boletus reticuloceps]|uniref:Uncharacterized protein n=1 Tax=Boletus reticuloceps TaxID=495285 RepID=A0A8I2YSP4_9AGAM|nr:hypothetical protein JVT61DRAFT_12679 [Boletus reticuloceps]
MRLVLHWLHRVRSTSFYFSSAPHNFAGNPVRETGPPACMAKLIMLRHKMQTSARKRRSPTSARQSRNFALVQPARPRATWVRFGRPFMGKQNH